MKIIIKGQLMSAKDKVWKNDTGSGISHQLKIFDTDYDALYTVKVKDENKFNAYKRQIGKQVTLECSLYTEKYSLTLAY